MLNKARSLYDTLKSSWNAGSNEDDIQLALYAAAEEEFESGNTKKGLLAKVSVEANYDDKVIKAKYIKARVDVLMSKRDSIVSLMRAIEVTNEKIITIDVELKSISQSNRVDKEPTAEDYIKAENDFYEEINRATYLLKDSVESYHMIIFFLYVAVFGILTWLIWYLKSLSLPEIAVGLASFVFLTCWAWFIRKRKKILSDRIDQVAEDKKSELEQANFIEEKTNEYCQERLSDREEEFLMQRKDLEEEHRACQQKMKSLQGELKNIFS